MSAVVDAVFSSSFVVVVHRSSIYDGIGKLLKDSIYILDNYHHQSAPETLVNNSRSAAALVVRVRAAEFRTKTNGHVSTCCRGGGHVLLCVPRFNATVYCLQIKPRGRVVDCSV